MTEPARTELSRRTALGVAASAAALARTAHAQAGRPETIAIIGTGNVGSALGQRWAALGHTIVYGSRNPGSEKTRQLVKESGPLASALPQSAAAKKAGLVLLAAPAQAALEVVAALGDVSGKILIDAMNLMSFKDGKLIEPVDTEALAARIQALAPGASVVKAFNTISALSMRDPNVTGGPVTVPLAGADAAAKARVTALVAPLGLTAFDMGGSDAFRWVEHLGRIFVAYSFANRPTRMEFGFRTWSA